MVLKFFILYICIIWIATIVWVVKDITNRSASITAHVLCILLVVLLPFIGIFLYLLVRPSNTLLEKYYSEIEENLNTMADFIHQHIEAQSNKDS
jgi:glucan phosphoethanolaminetransferase (alkaline phosphatase superfamily)